MPADLETREFAPPEQPVHCALRELQMLRQLLQRQDVRLHALTVLNARSTYRDMTLTVNRCHR